MAKIHSQHENLALEERLDAIRLFLYKELGGTIWYNYLWESPQTHEPLPEPQHSFGYISKNGHFIGGGILDKDIFNDNHLNNLRDSLLKGTYEYGLQGDQSPVVDGSIPDGREDA